MKWKLSVGFPLCHTQAVPHPQKVLSFSRGFMAKMPLPIPGPPPPTSPWTLSYSSSPAIVPTSLVTVQEVPADRLISPSPSLCPLPGPPACGFCLGHHPPSASRPPFYLAHQTSLPTSALNPVCAPTDLASHTQHIFRPLHIIHECSSSCCQSCHSEF